MNTLSKLFIGVLIAASGLAAHAGDADFTLTNRTGFGIESIFVAPTKSKTWGSDFLGEGTLRNGASRLIGFSKKSNHCIYDLRIHWVGYGEDEDTTWERLDLCAINKITLRYNRKTNETFADFD